MYIPYKFNRQEFAGSLGDLGVVLPLGIAMILVNGLNPLGLFFSVGLFYLLSGMYYRIPVPVEPMKVIGAYAVATGITASEIMASSLLIGVLLLIIALTGAMTLIGKYTPKAVVRGVQLSTGLLLMAEGVRFMIGASTFQKLQEAAEPYLVIQDIGPVPFGLVLGLVGGVVTLLLLDNKKLPAALVVVLGGMLVGLLLGTREGLSQVSLGFNLPEFMPFGFPSSVDFSFALLVLVLPQLPMTLGNAVIANVDLSRQYFGEAAHRATYKANCITMALANFFSFFVGGDAPLSRCRGPGRPLPFRGQDPGLQRDHRGHIHLPGCVARGEHPGHSLSHPHGRAGGAAYIRRQSTGPDHNGFKGAQGIFRCLHHRGHHPGHQPCSRVYHRHHSGLCPQI